MNMLTQNLKPKSIINYKNFVTFLCIIISTILFSGCSTMNLNFNNTADSDKITANNTGNSNENETIYICKKSLGNISINIDESQEWHMQLTNHQHLSDAYTYISDLIKISRCFNVIPNNVVIDNKRAKYELTVSAKFSESMLENLKPVANVVANKSTDNSYRNTAKVAELLMENFQVTDATVSLSFKDTQTDSEIQASNSVKDYNSSNLIKKATAFFMGVSDNDAENFTNSAYYQDENVRKKLSGKAIVTQAFISSYKQLLKELIDKNYISSDNYIEKVFNSSNVSVKSKNTRKVGKKRNKKK